MAIPYVSGPCHIYCGLSNTIPLVIPSNVPFVPGSSQAGGAIQPPSGTNNIVAMNAPKFNLVYYLGTCENGVQIREIPEYEPVMNDIGGTRKPFDRLYQGKDALSIGVLTRWNENVYQTIAAIPNPNQSEGGNVVGDIGTLMITEGWAYQVFIQFPYFFKALFQTLAMPAGYRFPFSYLEGPIEQERGTRPSKRHITFYHGRGYNPSTGAFMLYDYDLSAIPVIPPVPATGGAAPG